MKKETKTEKEKMLRFWSGWPSQVKGQSYPFITKSFCNICRVFLQEHDMENSTGQADSFWNIISRGEKGKKAPRSESDCSYQAPPTYRIKKKWSDICISRCNIRGLKRLKYSTNTTKNTSKILKVKKMPADKSMAQPAKGHRDTHTHTHTHT